VKMRRLGRGLDSLISVPPQEPASERTGAEEIEISRIELNPKQPRQHLDPQGLEALADSIRRAGVLQPVVVRRRGELYELVAGERRLRAAHLAGLETVPALVRDVPDEQMIELALIENVQREDLNPIEKARAIQRMMEELGLTQDEAAEKVSLKRSTVANLLRLLRLPEEVQEMVSRGTLSAGHARAVLALNDHRLQRQLAERIVREGLSVREAERLAATGLVRRRRPAPSVSPHLKRLQDALREALGTRVEIRSRGKRGRIIIHFDDNEQFERLFEVMTGTAEGPDSQRQA